MLDRTDQLREDVIRFHRKMRTTRSDHALTQTQLQTLGHLDRIGSMSARRLADLDGVAPQSVARTVASLERLGMVHRAPDPDDRRATVISITDAGRRTLTDDRTRHSAWLASALAEHCTDDERELLYAAGALLRRLAEAGE
ncbi:MAG: MarR family transcriptional regulator [Gordonia sp. (in: high G+C Gram-positive bacteria)]|uniref:MarR family winged helix-turn-helix transcriptional regulator n=1 Tax=Gordonia sp. (in: high G+C Gram-positive bacteria) TaxID=84139 RepID=UPI0039E5ED28